MQIFESFLAIFGLLILSAFVQSITYPRTGNDMVNIVHKPINENEFVHRIAIQGVERISREYSEHHELVDVYNVTKHFGEGLVVYRLAVIVKGDESAGNEVCNIVAVAKTDLPVLVTHAECFESHHSQQDTPKDVDPNDHEVKKYANLALQNFAECTNQNNKIDIVQIKSARTEFVAGGHGYRIVVDFGLFDKDHNLIDTNILKCTLHVMLQLWYSHKPRISMNCEENYFAAYCGQTL